MGGPAALDGAEQLTSATAWEVRGDVDAHPFRAVGGHGVPADEADCTIAGGLRPCVGVSPAWTMPAAIASAVIGLVVAVTLYLPRRGAAEGRAVDLSRAPVRQSLNQGSLPSGSFPEPWPRRRPSSPEAVATGLEHPPTTYLSRLGGGCTLPLESKSPVSEPTLGRVLEAGGQTTESNPSPEPFDLRSFC
jgi:hypothetical protein